MGDLQIRWAALEDAGAVAVVHVDSWRVAYQGLIDQQILDSLQVEQRSASWLRWIESSISGEGPVDGLAQPHRILVAELDGRIVGWATFGAGRDSGMSDLAELAGLYVHPDHWSEQIGHTLLRRVEHELLAEGRANAYLWVLSGNERAIGFYTRHGWEADGTEKFGEAGGARQLHELRYIRRLN